MITPFSMAHSTLGLTCFPVWIPLWALGSFNMYLILSTLVSSTECWPRKYLSNENEADEFSFSAECITWLFLCCAVCGCYAQSSLTMCNPMDYTLPVSSAHGISRQEYWKGLPFLTPRIFPTHGLNPRLLYLLHSLSLCHPGSPVVLAPHYVFCSKLKMYSFDYKSKQIELRIPSQITPTLMSISQLCVRFSHTA